jgi:hypothetical protein
MLLCESSIAALYTDFKQGGNKHVHVRTALERERLAVPPDSEYAREIDLALKSLNAVFSPSHDAGSQSNFESVLQRLIRARN